MGLSLINLILLLAAGQGFFLTALIFHKHGKLFANRFLVTLIFFYSLLLLYLVSWEIGFAPKHPFWALITLGFGLIAGPLHYLYARYLMGHLIHFEKGNLLHFIPFMLYELYALYEGLAGSGSYPLLLLNVDVNGPTLIYLVFNWIIIIQVSFYMIRTFQLLARYQRDIQDVFSTINQIKLDWLRNITFMPCIFVTIFIMEMILLMGGINLSNYFNLTSGLLAIYVYALGYLGLLKSEVFSSSTFIEPIRYIARHRNSTITKSGSVHKYDKSGLSDERGLVILTQLFDIMRQEQPYTKSDLTLTRLAELLDVSPHNLSEVINTRCSLNFFDFINQYRIDKVKADMADKAKQNLTLLAMAYDAGFNSKSSFNSSFKKWTNLTPSEYRKTLS